MVKGWESKPANPHHNTILLQGYRNMIYSPVMATLKQKKLVTKLLENPRLSVSAAMKEVGYSAETAKVPSDVTRSKGWKELLDQYLPDETLAAVHTQGLQATKIHTSHTEPDREIEDYAVRKSYLELAYKVKGRLAPDTQVNQFTGDMTLSFAPDEDKATQDTV